MIEVEKIAVFDKTTHDRLLSELPGRGAKDLGENHTENIFYMHNEYQLKVSKALSKDKAKLALKIKRLGDESAKEVELTFALQDAGAAEEIIDFILPGVTKIPTTQQRHDFVLNGVTIAVKYSDDWGYHAELEQIVASPHDTPAALQNITKVAKALGLTVLTEDEEKQHILKKLAERGK